MEKQLQINILPIENNSFSFSMFCKKYNQFEKNELLYFTRINGELYGISFCEYQNYIKQEFTSFDNIDLTKWYLFNLLHENCKTHEMNFQIFRKFTYRIDVVVNSDYYGDEVISITPTYLNSNKKFGFILNYRFKKRDEMPFSIEIQKRSLSLDKNGHENKNYYIDKNIKITNFINKYYEKIFYFQGILVKKSFETVIATTLMTKRYEFGNRQQDNSQFQGIKKFGPFSKVNADSLKSKICFIYKNNEKNFSYKLYNALEGKTYSTFLGMEKMFQFPLNKNTVLGRGVDEYTEDSINIIISELKMNFPDSFIVPILIVPWNKENATSEQQKLYYKLKYLFLVNKMPSQFISAAKVMNDNILKWSVSSLAIQIFSKLGGSPWIVIPKTNNCLIIGIGQTYKRNENSKINRFFSYSILTDTTGLFKGIRILANTNNPDDYAYNLSKSIKEIVEEYNNDYSSFVIHTSFRMKNKDIKIIKKTLDNIKITNNSTLAILRFDDHHDYICFDQDYNSLIPLESTKICLSFYRFLIWFEGQQYGQFAVHHRIGAPIKIDIDYPDDLDSEKINDYLQDSINLSGANWRGFNAKSIPISLLYAELISKFVSAFDEYNLEPINIENFTPWFL